MPPPVRAAMLAEWCGLRNGRCEVNAPPSISPATEAIIETSSSSDGESGGRIDGSRAASIDLPAPGAPIISKGWPPGAVVSRKTELGGGRLPHFRLRPRQHLRALEMVGDLDQRVGRDDLDVGAGPG